MKPGRLTVNGKAELVVLAAEASETWADKIERAEAIRAFAATLPMRDSKLAPMSPSPAVHKCPSDSSFSQRCLYERNGRRSWTIGDTFNLTIATQGLQFDQSSLFLFLDEHPTLNDGYFHNDFSAYTWSDLPASYHRGASCLSFADGHWKYRWLDSETKRLVSGSSESVPVTTEGL
jgi:hypothetical protein